MTPQTRKLIASAESHVQKLIEECRKQGPLYEQNPKIVAHVSRTGKWFLNAITRLNTELQTLKETP